MYKRVIELIFPTRLVSDLSDIRGETWQNLVRKISEYEYTSVDRYAFTLLMVRLGNCTTCQSDSYRAMRGCIHCARQSVTRFRGSDEELLDMFAEAYDDVKQYLDQSKEPKKETEIPMVDLLE
jgi:hypothetical protein